MIDRSNCLIFSVKLAYNDWLTIDGMIDRNARHNGVDL